MCEDDFPRKYLPLARQVKAFFCREAAFGGAFPPRDPLERQIFLSEQIEDAAKDVEELSPDYLTLLDEIKQIPVL